MRRTAEDLNGQCRLNSARALFQKANVLLFRFANSAERRPETDSDPIVRFVVRILDTGVIEREFRGCDRKLRVAIESFQPVRRKKFLRIPILDLSRDANAELAHVEILDLTNASFLGANAIPKTFDAFADASDRT